MFPAAFRLVAFSALAPVARLAFGNKLPVFHLGKLPLLRTADSRAWRDGHCALTDDVDFGHIG